LADYGAKVAIADIDPDTAEALADEINAKHSGAALAVFCNVADPVSVGDMITQVIGAFGGIHILHNNVSGKPDDLSDFLAPFEDYKLETWQKAMSVSLDGMFLVAQAAGKQMIKQGEGGSIIQTSSTYGLVGPDFRIYEGSEYLGHQITTPCFYAPSKAAIAGLTRYLATYWANKGIRVNTLVPGGVESGQNESFQKNYANRTPMGRMAHRDELVGALVYLASNASSYVTGQMLVVDGGWTAW
jgi:NAD(P)-dependent dehydrogenase (short-subunit alcohol dehydrogenase family)